MALIEIPFCNPSTQRSLGALLVAAGAVLSILSGAPAEGAESATAPEVKEPILDSETRLERFEQHLAMKEESPFKKAKWSYLGPTNVSGRCTDVEAVYPRGQQYAIWIASATGGVWKSTNEGTTFEPVFDEMPCASIGDIAIDPTNPDVVWVGTGEANIFRSSGAGCGVFKTTDGGETWTAKGLAGTHTIPRIRIHPVNPDIVWVAAGGHEWTKNPERGLFKTTDGGESWSKILYVDDETGVNDIVLHPTDPDTIYATTWQRTRLKWSDPRNFPHYENSGVWKSTDGGENWDQINNGLPEAAFRGRIGIDIARSNPDVVYAYVDSYEVAEKAKPGQKDSYGRPMKDRIKGATIYRSADAGATWEQTSGLDDKTRKFMEDHSATYGWVFSQIRVDPQDEDRIYTMGLALNVSEDGGRTAKVLTGMHLDHHGLWIDPSNSDYLLNVQDGGLAISYDGGENWKIPIEELPLAQFFNVSLDMNEPFRVYGSIQDHGSYSAEVDISEGRTNLQPVEFDSTLGGEGTTHAIDPRDGTIYASSFYGNLDRQSADGGEKKDCLPPPFPDEEMKLGQWLAPTVLSVHNPDYIYHGLKTVMMSRDRCISWEDISPVLSHNDPDKSGDIYYQTVTALAESPLRFGLLYAGTDDGRVWRTKNNGGNWEEIGGAPVPAKWVSRLVASEHDLSTVYMTQTGRRDDDFQVYVWKSTDLGETWVDISGNVPLGPVNVIREDPDDENQLFLGTDASVYVTQNGGETWAVLGHLPFAYVHDLAFHPRDRMLVIGTHGRGVWVFDGEQLDPRKAKGIGEVSEEDLPLLLGTWNGEIDAEGRLMPFSLEFLMEDEEIGGSMEFVMGTATVSEVQFDGELLAFKATFSMGEQEMTTEFEGQIEEETMTGTGESPMGKSKLTATKEADESASTE
jgi:photosystem II stability/assembly factor-like uncharacterized protein